MATDRPLMGGRTLGAAALMAVAISLLYRSVLPSWLADLWSDENYSHGLIVPFVSLWLAYERRHELARHVPQPAWLGLAIVLAAIVLLLLGRLAAELFVMRVSLLVLLTGLVLYVFGYHYLRVLGLPLAFLLFMVPLPTLVLNAMTLPLQFVASEVAVTLLHALHFPALREGNVIVLPNAALEVVEACSGLRSLISLAAMSVIVALLMLRSLPLRLLLILSSVPIAVLTNGARISVTGILAYYYGAAVAEGFFHGFSGWIVFLTALALLSASAAALHPFDRAGRA